MSAKQRHKQRVIQRLKEKLENLKSIEENLHTVVREHVLKAEKRCLEVLRLEDTSQFLQQYGKVEQLLDAAFNLVEVLTSSAEDMIENVDSNVPDEDVFTTDRSIHSSTHIPSDDKLETNRNVHERNAKTVARQLSDKDIERELQEMIQSSSRKRHGSSEAASQTVPEEVSLYNEQTGLQHCDRMYHVSQSTGVNQMKQSIISDTVSERGQSVSSSDNTDENKVLNKEKDFYETCVKKDSKVLGKQIGNNINETSVGKSKKLQPNNSGSKSAGKTKTDKGVPKNVRKHLNKEPSQDTDGSSSSQVDSVTFNQDVILASSPKRNTANPKKKKSPKKKAGKSNIDSLIEPHLDKDQSNKASSERHEDVKLIDKDVSKAKQGIGKYSESEQSMRNRNVLKGEQGEISSEPTITSSEQSILEHELTEMRATESSETSTSSDLRSLLKDGQAIHTLQVGSGVNSQKELHPSQKYQLEAVENSAAVSKSRLEEISDKSDNTAGKEDSAQLKVKDTTDNSGKKGDSTSTEVLTAGNLLVGKITPIIVSEVVSPWCFFVQKNGPQLSQLMEQICIYMAQGGLQKQALLEPEIGTLCLAKYTKDSSFYRAYVTQIYRAIQTHNSEVDVLYVDYGNRERVKVTQLRTLPEKFKALPTQAICCALAEVMPCNKYCVWAEDDIHVFRQYVTGQQLSCTPPTCRSSGVSLPLLVELIVSLPVPTIPQGGIYLSQFSIAQLMINAKKARHVEVTEQLGLLAKSGEGAEEAAILSHDMTTPSRLAIMELSESQCDTPQKMDKLVKNKDLEEDANQEQGQPKVEQLNLNKETDMTSTDVTSSGYTSKQVRTDLISPRSENSDTESQRDEGHKGSSKIPEKGQSVTQGSGSRGQLDKIKEETVELEYCETSSTTTSLTTDIDFPPEKGIHLADLHFDLDDLYFNPQGQEVMLAHVRSPDEFFVHIISQQSGETLDRLMKNLNSLFENVNRRKLTKLSKTFEPEEKKLCCAQFLQDNNFYRGIIRNTKPEKEIMKGRILVHYIDFGDEEWLPKRRIFPLPPQFCSVPRLAVKCSLAYIKPVCAEGEEPDRWSKTSLEKFIDIAGLEKTLHMHVVHGSLEDFKKGNPCEDSPVLGILLVDNTGTEEVCINMDLIREGVAQLDTSQAKHEKDNTQEMSPDTRLEKWNPMEEDFLSKRNSYKIDIDDAGVATTGYKAKDEERLCKFFSTGRDCWRGERCPFRHIHVESGITYDQEPVYAISDNQRDFLPQTGSWVAIEISTILSPSHFYAILPLGSKSLDATCSEPEKPDSAFGVSGSEETLDDLLDALNTEYKKRPAHDGSLLLRAIGEIVVARFSLDQSWYRARIIEVTEEKVKVFFVDFGNTEWLPEEEVTDIKPEFLHLPFQAVECFMNVEPKANEKWTKDARVVFRELVDGKTLVGHIKSRSWNGCLWVELYDTSTEEDVNVGEELVERGHALKGESQESHTDYSSNISPASGDPLLVPG
ncbi:uncharacterized protein LOC123530424 isoform X2 [Mercenaria mercenaria]|uniref:uncharacterized protein LOC123530424 isoform X2 n=1 Tax=Mercenaria mercenaria TaxID=6596 RepID=UPI00234EE44A|nr:uncharacterized protein LOC123530424 isoform X2 [Mercenaria mercenaria]